MPSQQSCKFNFVNIWEQNIVNLENVICSQIEENIACIFGSKWCIQILSKYKTQDTYHSFNFKQCHAMSFYW